MKKILVVNTGSSSVKYKLFDMPAETVVASGMVENIGENGDSAQCRHHRKADEALREKISCRDHREAIFHIFQVLSDPEKGAVSDLSEIAAVGHRVVHGGERFSAPVGITKEVLAYLENITSLAPLHLPLNIAGIRACMEIMPDTDQAACFDTAFFHALPRSCFLYPVPYEWYERYGVRRYGFHGISYEYLAGETARMLDRQVKDLKIIACHLGNGCSIMACDKGDVCDTSMGFTPLEGLMMGTRSGSFDPAILPYMMAQTGLSADRLLDDLNTKSGLAGISGISRDMRDIVAAAENGSDRAVLAFDMFAHILKKYIGAYFFRMGGADAVVFAGGIGENSPEIREAVCKGLAFAGIKVDPEKNRGVIHGQSGRIHKKDARVHLLVIPANEELMIARSVFDKKGHHER